MQDKLDALDAMLTGMNPGVVDSAQKTIAGVQRQFVGDPEGLIEALVAVSTVATQVIATIAEAHKDTQGVVH